MKTKRLCFLIIITFACLTVVFKQDIRFPILTIINTFAIISHICKSYLTQRKILILLILFTEASVYVSTANAIIDKYK